MLRHFFSNHFRTLRKWVHALFPFGWPRKYWRICASCAGCPYKVFVITDMMSLWKKSVLKMDFSTHVRHHQFPGYSPKMHWGQKAALNWRKWCVIIGWMKNGICSYLSALHFCVTKIKLTHKEKNSDHVMMQGLKNWRIIDAHFSHLLWMIVRTFSNAFLSPLHLFKRFFTPKCFIVAIISVAAAWNGNAS